MSQMKFYSLFIFFKESSWCLTISSFSNVNIDQPNIGEYEAWGNNLFNYLFLRD